LNVDVLSRDNGNNKPTDNAGNDINGINADNFAARFTKTVNVGAGCSFQLQASGDDGYRVYVNGVLQNGLSSWATQAVKSDSGAITLGPGDHTIVFEYYEKTGQSVYKLEWKD
jgi:hypothetical protein